MPIRADDVVVGSCSAPDMEPGTERSCDFPWSSSAEPQERNLQTPILGEGDVTGVLPVAQVPIGPLAREPDYVAELLLRDRDTRLTISDRALHFGEPQQSFGDGARRVAETEVLDLFGGASQALTDDLEELHGDHRLIHEDLQEVAPIQDDEIAVGDCGCVGGARLAVQQRDLAEDIA